MMKLVYDRYKGLISICFTRAKSATVISCKKEQSIVQSRVSNYIGVVRCNNNPCNG